MKDLKPGDRIRIADFHGMRTVSLFHTSRHMLSECPDVGSHYALVPIVPPDQTLGATVLKVLGYPKQFNACADDFRIKVRLDHTGRVGWIHDVYVERIMHLAEMKS